MSNYCKAVGRRMHPRKRLAVDRSRIKNGENRKRIKHTLTPVEMTGGALLCECNGFNPWRYE